MPGKNLPDRENGIANLLKLQWTLIRKTPETELFRTETGRSVKRGRSWKRKHHDPTRFRQRKMEFHQPRSLFRRKMFDQSDTENKIELSLRKRCSGKKIAEKRFARRIVSGTEPVKCKFIAVINGIADRIENGIEGLSIEFRRTFRKREATIRLAKEAERFGCE